MKRVFSILLTICLVFSIVPAGTFAPAVAAEPAETVVNTSYITYVQDEGYYGHNFVVGPEAGLTRQEAGAYLRFCLLKAYDHFGFDSLSSHYAAAVTYYDSKPADEDTLAELLGEAIGYGCYTRSPVTGWVWETVEEAGGVYRNTVMYEIPYNLIGDSEKVEYTIESVETIIRELDLEGKSDYEKILLICQYICENVEYGIYNSDSYYAYGALKYGLAVCDGYEDLTNALLTEAGLDSTSVAGFAGGGSHTWNIVLLDGLYYNLDTTWADDVFFPGMEMNMSWILRGATDFPDHYRGYNYATDSFHAKYPMATTQYDGSPGTLHSCNGEHNYEVVDPARDVSVRPTATSPGEILLTCSWCYSSKRFEMPALNTDAYDCEVDTEVTCTTNGKYIYWWKGYSLGIVVRLPATGHSYVDGICTACGLAGAHEWAAATCTAPAICTLCGATEGSALGHSWTDATCTAPATCVTCGETQGDALPHTEVIDAGVAPTCTTPGLRDGSHCAVCNTVIVEQEEWAPSGHHEITIPASPSTCRQNGLTEGSYCLYCNEVFVAQQPVPFSDHVYANGLDGTCNVCGIRRETTEDRTVMHMFRMYDPNSGEHFYTGSEEERENLVAAGWHYEGVGFTFSRTTGLPVYRVYDPITGEHLYTMQEPVKTGTQYEGKDLYECEGRIWLYEGIAFNSAYTTEVPQYRLHNPNATRGAYHFTASSVELYNLVSAGWEYQGIGFYSSWK